MADKEILVFWLERADKIAAGSQFDFVEALELAHELHECGEVGGVVHTASDAFLAIENLCKEDHTSEALASARSAFDSLRMALAEAAR